MDQRITTEIAPCNQLSCVAQEVADSRGGATVKVTLQLGRMIAVGDVPAGASKGQDEARTVDVPQALHNIETVLMPLIKQQILDLKDPQTVVHLDRLMATKAGPNFADLGANAVLPLSRALWRMAAQSRHQELWQFIRENFAIKRDQTGQVYFLMNIFNGGLHALRKTDGEKLGKDRIDIQEIMIVPYTAKTYTDALRMGDTIDQELKKLLESQFDKSKVTRADEAGFSVKGLGDSDQAIGLVFAAIRQAGFVPGKDIKLALDVAAGSFYDKDTGQYLFQGKHCGTKDMIGHFSKLVAAYPSVFLSIEDGLDENDWTGWATLSDLMGKNNVVTVGDDLFVTQLPRLEQGIATKAASAILIKVNQNGTLTGTLDVMRRAQQAGMYCIVSHRSGETLDDSIADLAIGMGAFGLKTGDPQPPIDFPDKTTWVRRQKYLRMCEIEHSLM